MTHVDPASTSKRPNKVRQPVAEVGKRRLRNRKKLAPTNDGPSFHLDKRSERLLADHVAAGPDDELLTTEQVAAWFQCSVAFLEILRGRDDGPEYERVAPKMVRYRRGAVRTFLRQRQVRSTEQYMNAKLRRRAYDAKKHAAKKAAKRAAR